MFITSNAYAVSRLLEAATQGLQTKATYIWETYFGHLNIHTLYIYIYIHIYWAQSYLTLWDPIDYSLPSSPVHGIFQAIMEWVAISSSRESSQPRDQTHISCVSCTGRQVLHWATWEALYIYIINHNITGATTSKVAMNMYIQFSCAHKFSFLQGKCPGV